MGIFALSQRAGETNDAAGKAMRDVYAVLRGKGGRVIWSVPKSAKKLLKIIDLPYLALFLLFRAGKRDYLFYSIPENHIKIRIVKAFSKIKKYRIICFVNDLNAFRYGNAESEEVKIRMGKEAAAIGAADFVLVPNRNTIPLLRENGVSSEMIPVGVWDYLMEEEDGAAVLEKSAGHRPDPDGKIHVAFAGNLNKSEFLSRMELREDSAVSMELWGKLDEAKREALPAFCRYHGVLSSEEVPLAVCGMDYGLVWDGTGADGIEGGLGEYLQYNNSHKCGLYLASGIPAIVWEKSGMAEFVTQNQCGICIDRLGNLEHNIETADFKLLKKNALLVAGRLQRGAYLSRAFDEILGEGSR